MFHMTPVLIFVWLSHSAVNCHISQAVAGFDAFGVVPIQVQTLTSFLKKMPWFEMFLLVFIDQSHTEMFVISTFTH